MDLERRLEAEQVYRAAVGPRADYYVPKFIGFDTYDSSRISWNWPAFFFTFPWLLYRRMFGYAALYFLLVPIVAAILYVAVRLALPPELAPFFTLALVALIFYIAPPMYANAMYHTTIGDRIRKSTDGVASVEEQVRALESEKSTSVVALVAGVVLASASSGWSQYNRVTSRAQEQVADAIAHTGYIQADLEDFHRSHGGRWARNAQELGIFDFANGDFIETVEVKDGEIVVTFNTHTASWLRGKQLLLKPNVEADRYAWICDRDKSSVPRAFWPRTCAPRDVSVDVSEPTVTLSAAPPRVTFASGKASVPLSAKFKVTVDGDTLTALFGAQQDHKVEITFIDRLSRGAETDLAAQFVHSQAARADTKASHVGDRAFFRELGEDLVIDGRNHEVTHWQIGAGNCMFTMTLTAPLPSTNDNRDFMYDDEDQILHGIGCVR